MKSAWIRFIDHNGSMASPRSPASSACFVCAVFLAWWSSGIPLFAQDSGQILRYAFETEPPIGQPATRNLIDSLSQHLITTEDAHTGKSCERLVLSSSQQQTNESRICISAPEARVFNELSAKIWVRANCVNLRLGMRLRFPHQIDPRTGAALEIDHFGAPYQDFKNWQQLVCQATDEELQSRLIRVRSQLSDGINPVKLDDREAYVDQIILQFQIPAGQSILEYDDLEFGPVVRPARLVTDVRQQERPTAKLTIENDRIRKNGEPFFPIITLYHSEPLDLIAQSGVNMLWIRNYDDRSLLSALQEMEIGAIASPPQPPPAEAILNRSAIPSMPEWTSPIWAWMLGINLPASDRPFVTAWADQVRDADREIHRPIIADVAAEERDFHRKTDLISITRCQLNSSHSSLDHFEDLRGRRSFALPGKPPMTFVQTEASGALLNYFADQSRLPIIEPEQILHQGFEAIAAGFKGVGFWKQIPFDAEHSGLQERLDAIRIFSIHARLLAPFIATGRIVDEVPVQVDLKRPGKQKGMTSPLATRWDRPLKADGQVSPANGELPEIRATVFHSDLGRLILLVWHEPGAQCVPGSQTASNVRVLIGGIGDVATACEVTPTSVGQSNLAMERVSGGTEFTLKEFDQYAAIIVTSTPDQAVAIQKQCWQTRQSAAEAFVELAQSKLSRVRETQQLLEEAGAPPVLNAGISLGRAEQYLEEAQANLAAGRADETRVAGQRALQQLRTLQRSHWDLAMAPLTGPTTTLEATSFQTLPDHWKLMAQLTGLSNKSENLLPGGNFEDEAALSQSGDSERASSWSAAGPESRHTSLRMVRGGDRPGSYLSLIVKPDAPLGQSAGLISPQLHASAGDLVIVTGQMNIRHPLSGPDHRFEIFDTLGGREGALSFKKTTAGWTPFRLIRRAPASGPFRIQLELLGPGIVDLDDLDVRLMPAGQILRAGGQRE